ncbi:hypothetical protein AJ80_02518 [Polytolypa hystricis UAMH7299]|uniref:Spo12 family protein n=1 Tax=Polytolypa hystricis (strain UAMH7299) TaxID=1447883 RepID=A0A2B7YRA2_POLH7|nr:hypothetical protein AJ80_02518 [Polytolypa hystricis UAMH7299]
MDSNMSDLPRTTTSSPLATRSTNTHLSSMNEPTTTPGAAADLKAANTKTMEYHRQVLKEKLEDGKLEKPGHYVSPSDGIMSPCTKKLSDLKTKRFKNSGKGQSLFAKAIGKKSIEKMNAEQNSNTMPSAE